MSKIWTLLILVSISFSLQGQKSYKNAILYDENNKPFFLKDSIEEKSIIIYYGEPACTCCVEHLLLFLNNNKLPFF